MSEPSRKRGELMPEEIENTKDYIRLNEATLEEISEELSRRDLSFVFIGQYFEGQGQDTFPFFSFGLRKEDICHMLGLTDIAKDQIRCQFHKITDVTETDQSEEIK